MPVEVAWDAKGAVLGASGYYQANRGEAEARRNLVAASLAPASVRSIRRQDSGGLVLVLFFVEPLLSSLAADKLGQHSSGWRV